MTTNQTDETPLPVTYIPVVPGIRVGCGVLELADRMVRRQGADGGPKMKPERVLSVTIEGDIASKAEARAIAAALEAYAEMLA